MLMNVFKACCAPAVLNHVEYSNDKSRLICMYKPVIHFATKKYHGRSIRSGVFPAVAREGPAYKQLLVDFQQVLNGKG